MENIRVLLPGSYDPVTTGHLDIIKRAAREFSTVYVALFINPDKTYLFSEEERLTLLRLACEGIPNVIIGSDHGMVADFVRRCDVKYIIKGYRNEIDLAYEQEMAEVNKRLAPECETLLWECRDSFENVSSTALRDSLLSGDVETGMIPAPCRDQMLKFFSEKY